MEETLIMLIAVAALALAVATSAQAMSPAPLHQSDGMITKVQQSRKVRLECGPGQVRRKGVCVLKYYKPRPHPGYRRCVEWNEGFCVEYD